jgi:hypothetical protein
MAEESDTQTPLREAVAPASAGSPLFRVFWRGMEVGVDTNCWASHPEHVDDHLFITRTGRVFWLSHAGMGEITDECRLEIA